MSVDIRVIEEFASYLYIMEYVNRNPNVPLSGTRTTEWYVRVAVDPSLAK